MNDPDIYTIKLTGYPEDHYVLWRDYEKLKAEVERLRASSFVTAVPVEQYEGLKGDVAELRKEVADLQESNHILNETIAKIMKGAKR